MTIKTIVDKGAWNAFVKSLPDYSFLESSEWGQVQQRAGEVVEYLGFYEGERLVGVALLIGVNARRGQYWLCPHGPLFTGASMFEAGLQALVGYAKQHTFPAVALRVAPLLLNTATTQAVLRRVGFKKAPMHVHAELTWVLDITEEEEALLQKMRKTTRHAIKKAEAAGVHIEIINDARGLDRFWPLYDQTRQRHGFVPFSRQALAAQIEIFSADNQVYTVVATYQGADVAAAILIHFGTTVYYYHGASQSNLAIPAPHLLQWRAIQEAKRRGATRYNFWGIAPDNAPKNHPFAGITIFKKGFGGTPRDYAPAHDHSLSWRYLTLWAVDSWRRYRRGF